MPIRVFQSLAPLFKILKFLEWRVVCSNEVIFEEIIRFRSVQSVHLKSVHTAHLGKVCKCAHSVQCTGSPSHAAHAPYIKQAIHRIVLGLFLLPMTTGGITPFLKVS